MVSKLPDLAAGKRHYIHIVIAELVRRECQPFPVRRHMRIGLLTLHGRKPDSNWITNINLPKVAFVTKDYRFSIGCKCWVRGEVNFIGLRFGEALQQEQRK